MTEDEKIEYNKLLSLRLELEACIIDVNEAVKVLNSIDVDLYDSSILRSLYEDCEKLLEIETNNSSLKVVDRAVNDIKQELYNNNFSSDDFNIVYFLTSSPYEEILVEGKLISSDDSEHDTFSLGFRLDDTELTYDFVYNKLFNEIYNRL